jgi:hypothetical protein
MLINIYLPCPRYDLGRGVCLLYDFCPEPGPVLRLPKICFWLLLADFALAILF